MHQYFKLEYDNNYLRKKLISHILCIPTYTHILFFLLANHGIQYSLFYFSKIFYLLQMSAEMFVIKRDKSIKVKVL